MTCFSFVCWISTGGIAIRFQLSNERISYLGIFQQFWMIAPAEILGVANVYHGFVHLYTRKKSRSFRVLSSDLLKLNRWNPYFPSGFDVHITPHHDAIRPTSVQRPGSMSRAFPWLELDDDRKTTLPMGKMVGMVGRGTPWLVPLGTTARPSLENRESIWPTWRIAISPYFTHISDLTNAKKPLDFTSSNRHNRDWTNIWDLPKWGASRKMRHFTSNGHLKQKSIGILKIHELKLRQEWYPHFGSTGTDSTKTNIKTSWFVTILVNKWP